VIRLHRGPHRGGLALALLTLCSGCKSDESATAEPSRTREPAKSNAAPAPAPASNAAEAEPHDRCPTLDHVDTDSIWDGWLSRADEDRQGPDAERVGDTCLLTDLQFMDAPLYRVRESVGDGSSLIPALPGVKTRHDSTNGAKLEPGALVLGSQLVESYRCVYTVSEQGTLAAGFMLEEHLERVDDPATEPLEQLVGHWANEGWEPARGTKCVPNHFSISRSPQGEFVVEGEASWCCGCDTHDTNFGGVAGRIEFCEGEGVVVGDCQMAFVQRGPFLMVGDDLSCGGMNVTFRGIYLRSAEAVPSRGGED
jgi:hypothetical protein